MSIVESRNIEINNKIIKLEDVHAVTSLLEAINNEVCNRHERSNFSYEVTCEDGSEYSGKISSIFDKDSSVLLKRVTSISLSTYIYIGTGYSYDDYATIKINIEHNRYCRIKISGVDGTFVNGSLRRIENVFNSFEPQPVFHIKHKRLIRNIFALGIGSIFFYALSFLPQPPHEDPLKSTNPYIYWLGLLTNTYYGAFLLKYFFLWSLGFIPADIIYARLSKLWPNIEIQIGPKHLYIESRSRKIIFGLMTLIAIPFCVNLFYDIAKTISGY